ncbi:hypothetical protein [Hyalangium sp.]|uniref:hypothetical protein n=1 Tax=Hyalangium sp. TaxID=2028555 RepID=UPI002D2EF4D9|nr:hypothetical protein [Hyalangium sp.]HYH97341.1 hypothetical protein [Hyalangium sp.]
MLMFSLVAVALAAEPTPTSTPLYPPAEAIADALSGPLVPMVGDTGFGPNERLPDCFYRNDRVIVINRYCSKREINTTGIQIMHPERGVLYFYAEARAPISSITREDYEQWRIEVRDPLPGLRVDSALAEVLQWMHRRTREAQQVCWTGFGSSGGVPTGCHYKTPEIKQAWMDAHNALLKSPPPGWYELVREMRGLIGKKPPPVKAPPAADTAGPGAARIVVRVFEYFTHRPVVGARVLFREPDGAGERVGVTDASGRVAVQTPSTRFEPVKVELEGLIPPEELRPIWGAFKTLDPTRHAQGKDEVRWELPVVHRAWLEANMKVRTREQADAVAADWGSECGPGGPSAVEFREGAWHYTFSCLVMYVDPWKGKGGGRKLQPDPPSAAPLYPPAEALADAVSGPLRHVGTTLWYGRFAIPSCIYRNEKVFVINSYCTLKEINRTGVIVIHPERGVVALKARGVQDKPVSTLRRAQYSEWGVSSTDGQRGLTLDASADALVAWEERRHRYYRNPGCGAGQAGSSSKMRGKCAEKMPEFEAWWQGVYPLILEAPPESWYALVKDLRQRARKDGKPDPRLAKGAPEE